MVFRGGRRGDQSSPTEFLRELQVINCQWGGGGVGVGVIRILQSLREDQVNFTMTKPKSSDPSPLNDKQ